MSALDGIRSAAGDKGWWIGELQAGQGATGVRVGTPVTPADVRLWGWAVLSRGARAISYYAYYPMSAGYESNGYGLIELDGTITDRAKAAGAFAATITREAALIDRARPRQAPVVVEARVLDAGDTRIVVAMNHDEAARRVTLTFAPAIAQGPWLDLERGAAVDVVDRVLSWDAGPRDVVVLVHR